MRKRNCIKCSNKHSFDPKTYVDMYIKWLSTLPKADRLKVEKGGYRLKETYMYKFMFDNKLSFEEFQYLTFEGESRRDCLYNQINSYVLCVYCSTDKFYDRTISIDDSEELIDIIFED